jgi:hypothetical protein
VPTNLNPTASPALWRHPEPHLRLADWAASRYRSTLEWCREPTIKRPHSRGIVRVKSQCPSIQSDPRCKHPAQARVCCARSEIEYADPQDDLQAALRPLTVRPGVTAPDPSPNSWREQPIPPTRVRGWPARSSEGWLDESRKVVSALSRVPRRKVPAKTEEHSGRGTFDRGDLKEAAGAVGRAMEPLACSLILRRGAARGPCPGEVAFGVFEKVRSAGYDRYGRVAAASKGCSLRAETRIRPRTMARD